MHSVDKTYFVGNEGKQTLARNVPALEVNEVYVYVYIYICVESVSITLSLVLL